MSLKYLKEISSVVTNYTKKAPFEGVEKGSKTDQLLEGLLSGVWETKDQAIQEIYGKPLKGRSFDMLQSRAKEQLVNSIFLLDTKRRFKSSLDKHYFSSCKNLLAGLILINRNAIETGKNHLEQSLEDSLKFDFTDLSITSLRILRYLSVFEKSKKKYARYNLLIQEQTRKLINEIRIEEINEWILSEFMFTEGNKQNFTTKIKSLYDECKNIVSSNDTYTTRFGMYRVGIRYFDSISDFKSLTSLANEWLDYLYRNPHFIQKVRLGEIHLHMLYGCLHQRDYHNGENYAKTCYGLFSPGTVNWLIFLEYYFLLALHTGRNQIAQNIYKQVISNVAFEKYSPQNKEKWKIFEAFLSYASSSTEEKANKFNIAKFLNEVPIFSKDKAGFNFWIIIAQVILLIKAGEFEKVVEKAEALKLYASRYIKKEKSPRSYYFIKMLLVMIKYDFEPAKTEEIAEKFFVKLKATHMGEQNQLETLEVIPYDLLWPRLLEQLRQK